MPRSVTNPGSAMLALAALALAGCLAAPPVSPAASGSSPRPASGVAPSEPPTDGPTASPAPSIDLSGLDEATAEAVRFRTASGLRADLDYIRMVAADPTATTEFGTPLLPAETRELFARSERADAIIPTINEYAAANRSVFGGIWIDQAAGGIVTVSFTDDLEHHRQALESLLAGRGAVNVVPARYAESMMRALQDRITSDRAWFKTIPAALQGVGYDTMRNVVTIDISTANGGVASIIAARFGVPGDALRVISDGTGIALEPWGTIHVRIVDVPANVRSELGLQYHSDRPGADCGMGDMGIGFGARDRVDLPCQGGHWVIEASRTIDGVIARGEVDLVPGGTATVTLRPIAP